MTRVLSSLKELLDTVGAQTIIKIDRREQAFIAQLAQFDLVEGGNFDVFSERQLPEEVGERVHI